MCQNVFLRWSKLRSYLVGKIEGIFGRMVHAYRWNRRKELIRNPLSDRKNIERGGLGAHFANVK